MDEILTLLEQAYRLSVSSRGVNNPLTREIGSLYIRYKGGNARHILAELVRAVNLQSRGGSADNSLPKIEPTNTVLPEPIPASEEKKPLPQTTPETPPASPPQPFANPAAINLEELRGLTANLISERYSAQQIRATVELKAKPDTGKTWDDYTPRQQAAFLVKLVKALPKAVTVPPKDRADQ